MQKLFRKVTQDETRRDEKCRTLVSSREFFRELYGARRESDLDIFVKTRQEILSPTRDATESRLVSCCLVLRQHYPRFSKSLVSSFPRSLIQYSASE